MNSASVNERACSIRRELLRHPSAWRSDDFKSPADFTHVLDDKMLHEVDDALAAVRGSGRRLEDITPADFALPAMKELLADIKTELVDGRGFLVLSGLPVGRYSKGEIGMLYWGLGTHLGRGLSQSVRGDRLGHVMDFSHEGPQSRTYRNNRDFSPHTDLCDLVGLACLCNAASGGVSQIASSLTLHNIILQEHPEYLEPLYRGYHFHLAGEEGVGNSPVTPHRVPIFSCVDGQISARYVRHLIEQGMAEIGHPLSNAELGMFEYLDKTARRADVMLEIPLQPGDCYFINNYTVLHARTGFVDHVEPERKRHLLRLWLEVPGMRSIDPAIHLYGGQGIAAAGSKSA